MSLYRSRVFTFAIRGFMPLGVAQKVGDKGGLIRVEQVIRGFMPLGVSEL